MEFIDIVFANLIFFKNIWWIGLVLLAVVTAVNCLIPSHCAKFQKVGIMLSAAVLFTFAGNLAFDISLNTITNISEASLNSVIKDAEKENGHEHNKDNELDLSEFRVSMPINILRLVLGLGAAVLSIVFMAKRIFTSTDSTRGSDGRFLGVLSIISYIGMLVCIIAAVIYILKIKDPVAEEAEGLLGAFIIGAWFVVVFFVFAPLIIGRLVIFASTMTVSGVILVLEPLLLLFSLAAGFYAFSVIAGFAVSLGGLRRHTTGKLPYFLMCILSFIPIVNIVPCFIASKDDIGR